MSSFFIIIFKMAKQMPLHAELSNCLTAYKETFEQILQCISSACDSTQKKHDSPITIQVQELLSIDAELKRHLDRMDSWDSRQKKIEDLEKQLKQLSIIVNKYAQDLYSSQMTLQENLAVATKLQKGVMQRRQVSSFEDLMNSSLMQSNSNGPSSFSYPWMPSQPANQPNQWGENPEE